MAAANVPDSSSGSDTSDDESSDDQGIEVLENALAGNVCRPRSNLNHGDRDQRLTGGKCFQWQLNNGRSWKNIENDHVIEINYCLPSAKGIKIYNTPSGAVNIDFTKMRVLKKDLKVRRLHDGQSRWIWYCMLRHKWKSYGNGTPASKEIERCFQMNRRGSFTFSIGGKDYNINFRGGGKGGEGGLPTTSFPAEVSRSKFLKLPEHCAVSPWSNEGGAGGWREYAEVSDVRQIQKHEITQDI